MDHLPRQLSGGESQRVAVAVALANEPDLLLADEVVGQLDSTTAADVMEMIFTASRERNLTVLYVTHDEQLARQAHHSLRLADHKVVRGMSIDASITVDSVVVEHQTSSGPVRALDGVSFTVDGGSSVAITGPSGGGKSTLLGVIGGLSRPTWAPYGSAMRRSRSCPSVIAPIFDAATSGSSTRQTTCFPSLPCWKTWVFSYRSTESRRDREIASGARRARPRWPGLPTTRPPLGRAATTSCGGAGDRAPARRSFSLTSRPARWIRPTPPASSTYCWRCSARSVRH